MRALVARDAAEAGEDERGGDDSGAEDEKAGAEELAGVWLHKGWRRAKALAVGSEHGVDDDAADRNVEPDGVRPARETAMRREASGEREEEGDEDHREADDGEKDMGCQQQPEIDEACGRVGFGEEHVAVQDVVDDVGDEKDARDNESAEHAVAVFDDLATTNVAKTDDQEDCAERVEDGVERGEEGQMGSSYVNGRMVVDEPREEERGDSADADDAGDDRGRSAKVRAGCCGLHLEEEASFGVEHHGG